MATIIITADAKASLVTYLKNHECDIAQDENDFGILRELFKELFLIEPRCRRD